MPRRFAKMLPITLVVAGALSLSVQSAAADPLSTTQVLAKAQSQSQSYAVTGLLNKLEKKTAPAAVAALDTATYESVKLESATPPAYAADHQGLSPKLSILPAPIAPPLPQPFVEDHSKAEPQALQTPPAEKSTPLRVESSAPALVSKAPSEPVSAEKAAVERVEPSTPALVDQAPAGHVVLNQRATPAADLHPAMPAPEQPKLRLHSAKVKPADIHDAKPKASAQRQPVRISDRTTVGGVSVSEIRRVVADHPEIRALIRSYGF